MNKKHHLHLQFATFPCGNLDMKNGVTKPTAVMMICCAYSNTVWLVESKNKFNRLPVNCVRTGISDSYCFVEIGVKQKRDWNTKKKEEFKKNEGVPNDKESGLTRLPSHDIRHLTFGDITEIDKWNSVGLFTLEFSMTSVLIDSQPNFRKSDDYVLFSIFTLFEPK